MSSIFGAQFVTGIDSPLENGILPPDDGYTYNQPGLYESYFNRLLGLNNDEMCKVLNFIDSLKNDGNNWPTIVYPQYNEQGNQDKYRSILPAETDDIKLLLKQFERSPLDQEMAQKIASAAIEEYPKLSLVVQQLLDVEGFIRAKHPTRLLFVGPSGCGKTILAEAIATVSEMTCIFIKASSIATTYQNSGAQFFEMLFRCLKKHSDYNFLVIIDEISAIAQLSQDGKDLQQNNTATSFWLGLDEIRNERHICVIGTDNKDPEILPDQIKTRFQNNIFHIKPPSANRIANFMRDCLEEIPKEDNYCWSYTKAKKLKLHACSDVFLKNLANSVTEISLREIEDLLEKAKALAISEHDDPYAQVQERHMLIAFADVTQSWFGKLWKDKSKYLNALVTPRSCTLYAAMTGLYMHFYSKEYREHGLFLSALATIVNNYLPSENGINDVGIISTLAHMLSNYKHRFFPIITN